MDFADLEVGRKGGLMNTYEGADRREGETIKRWLADTSRITRIVPPPRDRPRGTRVALKRALPPLAERLQRPSQTGLCPELQELFSWTMTMGELPFPLRKAARPWAFAARVGPTPTRSLGHRESWSSGRPMSSCAVSRGVPSRGSCRRGWRRLAVLLP